MGWIERRDGFPIQPNGRERRGNACLSICLAKANSSGGVGTAAESPETICNALVSRDGGTDCSSSKSFDRGGTIGTWADGHNVQSVSWFYTLLGPRMKFWGHLSRFFEASQECGCLSRRLQKLEGEKEAREGEMSE